MRFRVKVLLPMAVLLQICLASAATGNSTAPLLDIVQHLNKALQVELNIFVQLPQTSDEETQILLEQTRPPRLIITASNASNAIHLTFSSNLLAIVYLSPRNISADVELVNEVLWLLHFRDVLFVWRQQPAISELYHLFSICWYYGFTNVIVYTLKGDLYTYHPFPHIKVVALPDVVAYHNKEHLQNFQHFKLRCPILISSPRCYQYNDTKGQTVNSGYFFKMVDTFIQYYNGTFEEAVLPSKFALLPELLDGFAERKIDMVPTLLYMHPKFSHSIVIFNYNVFIMVPHAKPIEGYLYFIRPFDANLWTLICLFIGYATVLNTVIYWRQEQILDFGISFLEVFSCILYWPNKYRIQRTAVQAYVFILLTGAGFIFTILYATILSSLLATKLFERQINTFAEIADTDLYLPQTQMDIDFARNLSDMPQILLDRMQLSSPDRVHYLRQDLNTSFLISGIEDKIRFYEYQQKFLPVPLVKIIPDIVYSVPIHIPVAHGSPFLQLFNVYLLRICDAGILSKMVTDTLLDGIVSKEIRFFKPERTPDVVLGLGHFTVPIALWTIGLALGCLSFIWENIKFRLFKKK